MTGVALTEPAAGAEVEAVGAVAASDVVMLAWKWFSVLFQ